MIIFTDFGRSCMHIYLFFRLDFDILNRGILLLVEKSVGPTVSNGICK